MRKKIIIFLLFICICIRIGFLLQAQKAKYIPDYWTRYETLKQMYGESQYTTKVWKYWLPDETVYAYAGGAYIKGANPILIESTQPPLGKYLIGLSILVFNNEHIIGAVFFIFLIIGIYILIRLMIQNTIVALIGTFIALFERLFIDQLVYTPLLDIFHITFILYAIITASISVKKSKPIILILSFVLLSFAMLTKVWVTGLVFTIAISLYVIIKKPKYYLYLIVGMMIPALFSVLVYVRTLFDGYSVIEVVKVQKWLYWYHNSKINRFLTIWPLIFLNQWYVWWGEIPVIKDPNWSFSWPVVIGIGVATSLNKIRSLFKKIDPVHMLTAISILLYAIFISLGQATARYLLPFLPICYAMTIYSVFTLTQRIFIRKKHE